MSNRNQTGAGYSRAESVVTARPSARPRASLSWLIPDLALLPHRTSSALPEQGDVPAAQAVVPTLNSKLHPWFPQTESPESIGRRAEYPRDLFRYLWAQAQCEGPADVRHALSP